MKKYRLTKITVKTREIISVSKTAANENEVPACPVCRAPLPVFLADPESSTDAERRGEQNNFLEQNLTKEKKENEKTK